MHKDIKSFITQELNEQQRAAVLHESGALLIIAGAGSGKTRVITARIAHLITQKNVDPRTIVALTFTNKAALEMRERIEQFVGHETAVPFIGTFHAYCLRFLKTHQNLLKSPFVSILDADDQHKLLQGIITRNTLGKKITPKQISYQISQIKNQSLNPAANINSNPMLREIYTAYEHEKRLSKVLDFDDLLLEAVNLFKNNASMRTEYQTILKHVLVDEYQDTNIVQHELLKYLALNEKKKLALDSLCAVGDEDQSIYSWRGATVANIMNFSKDFPKLAVIKIEQNYRSVQPILEAANHVITHNRNRNPKSLWSEKKATDRIRIGVCLSEYQEADLICQFIKAHQARKGLLKNIAILYRAHFQSRAIEEALVKHAIPYTIIGGVEFYERKEIKDMLAYLRLIINPYDRVSLSRIINTPARGFGDKAEDALMAAWNQEPLLSCTEIIKKCIANKEFTGAKATALEYFIALFAKLDPAQKPATALSTIISHIQYFEYLKEANDGQEGFERIDNVKELKEALLHHEQEKQSTVTSFLDEVALMQSNIKGKDKNADTITMMTLHAAKGLEFNNVVIAGLEEGMLPSSRALSDEDALEEERRLLYVGITRAQERLLLTQARYRYIYGTMTDSRPSRFIKEIPESLAPCADYSYWTAAQIYSAFSSWLGAPEKPNAVKAATPVQTKKMASAPTWKKNQPVAHDTFGIGVISEIEEKSNNKTYLTVAFKSGKKKLAAEFVKAV